MDQERQKIVNQVRANLTDKGFQIEKEDLDRPWGGFLVIRESQCLQFAAMYFDLPADFLLNPDLRINGKVLFVAPNKRLSWQYHQRRTEIWQVLQGQVGVVSSESDVENALQLLGPGDQVTLQAGTRHRLVGLEQWGVITEIWQHCDPDHPSDEEDIIRIQDDFGR